jgi:hypothetical protein
MNTKKGFRHSWTRRDKCGVRCPIEGVLIPKPSMPSLGNRSSPQNNNNQERRLHKISHTTVPIA